uniref:6-phosphogluconolactonase n=1 Tax=Plectus sambesii TaxID=2011161 RepID=A0A914UII3_9BILA
MAPTVVVTQNSADLNAKLTEYIKSVLETRINASKENVIVGLSGGSMAATVCPIFCALDMDWSRVRLFLVDERMAPLSDADSNMGAYYKHLPAELSTHFPQFGPINNAEACASNYEAHLRSWRPALKEGWPQFDLLLLGLGPDGHTCSLFPDHPLLKENKKWIAPIVDSPKPPKCRITITIPVVNHAFNVAFIATGENKASVVKSIVKDGSSEYPAGLVKPVSGNLHWFLDAGSASQL